MKRIGAPPTPPPVHRGCIGSHPPFDKTMRTKTFVCCLGVFCLASAIHAESPSEHFERRIRPLLVEKCLDCHSGSTPEGKLDLSSKASFDHGGMHGAMLIPGDAKSSLFYDRLVTNDRKRQMPPGEPLTAEEIQAVKEWIEAGGVWPASELPLASPKPSSEQDHWAFQSIQPVAVPQVNDEGWCWTEIDRFIYAKLQSEKLTPVSDASPLTWLRRVTFDLTGLPPSLSAIQAFEEEHDAEAKANTIDRLLASREYAERFARRWLDLARYADTSGDGTDTPIPEARYYRDWVIEAIDQDMPFDQFIIEQLAGDQLAKASPDDANAYKHTIATGFIALSRRFGNSKFAEMHQIIDDSIDTVGKSMLGLSLGCARCHHHKFDPITMDDYYGLYGYFASTQYPHAGTEHQKERSDMPAIKVPPECAESMESLEAWAVGDKADTADAVLHIAGDPHKRGPKVSRGYLAFLDPTKPTIPEKQSGRLQFAQWIASPNNPLTARVIANRIWQSHFGKGFVPNPNNFGTQSPPPTHPELLDYLAIELMEHGWSIKHLHRLICNSHVYHLSSQDSPDLQNTDASNKYLARYPRQRLDAESFRDAMLMLSGQLKEGSNGRHPFKPTEQLKYNQGAPFAELYDHEYRSVYLMTPRLNRHPMMALFDGADANATTGERMESTVPLQALYVLNGEFVRQNAKGLAVRTCEYSSELSERVHYIYQLAYSRKPQADEIEGVGRYLERYKSSRSSVQTDQAAAEEEAWISVARVLLGSNEFMYLD